MDCYKLSASYSCPSSACVLFVSFQRDTPATLALRVGQPVLRTLPTLRNVAPGRCATQRVPLPVLRTLRLAAAPARPAPMVQKKKKKAPAVKKEPEDDAADDPEVREKDVDEHPFKPGAWLVVSWPPDGSERLATVIDRARVESQDQVTPAEHTVRKDDLQERDASLWRYYIHYADFNRRMDEWVKPQRVVLPPSKSLLLAEAEGKLNPHGPKKEEEPDKPQAPRGGSGALSGGSGALSFVRKRPRNTDAPTSVDDMEHDEHEGLDDASLREHEEVTKIKNFGKVELGRYVMDTWYFSPYPKEYYVGGFADVLYVDEVSLNFYKSRKEMQRASSKHGRRAPPGDEIYRDDILSMFEVDGNDHGEYCQNLCYFAKLFLDHKTLYFDVDPFLFYVLCEHDARGYHPVGFYSKEKYSEVGYNLACILAFPPYQRKGYGRFLIAFSYALSVRERRVGAPEKPLSDLGHIAYRSYWSATLLAALKALPPDTSSTTVMDLSKATSIMADDVAATLQYLGVARHVDGVPVVWAPPSILDGLIAKHPQKPPFVDDAQLHWEPYYTDVKRDKFSIRAKRPTSPATM